MINYKTYTILLLIAWVSSPITSFSFLIWFVAYELTPIFTIATLVFFTPFIILTAIHIFIFIRYKITTLKRRLFNLVPLAGLSIYWLVMNFLPYRISLEPGQNDSPFDSWWYFAPQTAYGYPTPFYRIIDHPYEDNFKIIFDYASIIGNVFNLFGCLFFMTLILIFLNKKIKPIVPTNQ